MIIKFFSFLILISETDSQKKYKVKIALLAILYRPIIREQFKVRYVLVKIFLRILCIIFQNFYVNFRIFQNFYIIL